MVNKNNKLVAVFIDSTMSFYNSIMNDKIAYYLQLESYNASLFFLFGQKLTSKDFENCISMGITKFISFLELDKKVINYLNKIEGIDVVVVGRKQSTGIVKCAYTDDFKGGRIAAEYLFNFKSKNYYYLGYKDNECSDRRYEGYNSFLKENGKTALFVDITKLNRETIENIAKGNNSIFVYNDETLLNFESFIKRVGIKAKNIHLVGYDGIGKYYESFAQFDSVYFDYSEIAKSVVELLLNKGNKKSVEFDVTLNRVHS